MTKIAEHLLPTSFQFLKAPTRKLWVTHAIQRYWQRRQHLFDIQVVRSSSTPQEKIRTPQDFQLLDELWFRAIFENRSVQSTSRSPCTWKIKGYCRLAEKKETARVGQRKWARRQRDTTHWRVARARHSSKPRKCDKLIERDETMRQATDRKKRLQPRLRNCRILSQEHKETQERRKTTQPAEQIQIHQTKIQTISKNWTSKIR